MPSIAAKKPGDPVRVIRRTGAQPSIEGDWRFVRFEPDSGNLIAEKNRKRIACARKEAELLNFPGSEKLWALLEPNHSDEALFAVRNAWAELDITKAASLLREYGRSLDPSLDSCLTCADFARQTRALAEACESALTVLRVDMKRAESEYGRCPAGRASGARREALLERWRGLQARYAAKRYLNENIVPACGHLTDCLKAIRTANHKSQQPLG